MEKQQKSTFEADLLIDWIHSAAGAGLTSSRWSEEKRPGDSTQTQTADAAEQLAEPHSDIHRDKAVWLPEADEAQTRQLTERQHDPPPPRAALGFLHESK